MAPLLPGGKVAAGRRQEGLIALLLLRSGRRGRGERGRGRGRERERKKRGRGSSAEQKFTLAHSETEEGMPSFSPSLFLKEDAAEREREREIV